MNNIKITYLKIIKYSTYLLFFTLITYRILICFSFKHELCNGESNNIWTIVNVATKNHSFYTDPEKLPLVIYPYTPISEYPVILFSKLLNENSEYYIYQVTVIGRIFQLIMSLLTCFIIYKLSKNILSINPFQSLIISFIIFGLQLPTSMNIRPDATFFLLIVSTIYAFFKYVNDSSNKSLYIVSLLYVFCFFTKQDGLFLMIPIIFILIFKLKKFKSVIILSFYTLINLSVLGMFFIYLYGFNFIKNAFLGIHNTSTINQLVNVFYRFTDFYWINLILGLTISSLYYFKKNIQLQSLSIFCVFYFIIALLLSSKLGSWINYFYPFIIFSTIIILHYFSSNFRLISLVFLIFVSLYNSKIIYNYTYPYLNPTKEKHSYESKFQEFKLLEEKLNINKNDNILIPNIILRTFSFKNSIMINTEYYGYTKFKYEEFIKYQQKKIKHIIFKNEDRLLTNYLISMFKIDLSKYKKSMILDYNIYSYK